MTPKFIEIRDRMTFIPALALHMDHSGGPGDRLMWRAGFPEGNDQVILVNLDRVEAQVDPYEWGDRTMMTAHNYVRDHWADVQDGQVVDVEYILGETPAPKPSEFPREWSAKEEP